jgi:hypothetical protein
MLEVRATDDLDIDIVSLTLRQADVEELKATGTENPRDALVAGMEMSDGGCYTITMDELPIAICGTAPVELIPSFASIWMLGTEDIDACPTSFLRLCRKELLPDLISPYEMVFNVMDKRNSLHVRFVSWLGFTFIREKPFGPYGLPFYEFALINNRRSHV